MNLLATCQINREKNAASNVAESGRSFGELALLNEDCIRNASIITDERTDLIVINRSLYDRSIKSVQEAEKKAKEEFVNSCPLFCDWLPRFKKQVVNSLKQETFHFDSKIIKQGTYVDGIGKHQNQHPSTLNHFH